MKGPPLPTPRFSTVNQALAAAADHPSGITFVDLHERERFTPFCEIESRARRAAGALLDRGVVRGDRVAIVLPTSLGFLDAFFGALLAGAVPVPLYPPLRLGRLSEYHDSTARMLGAVGASLVVVDDSTGRLLGRAIELARPPLGWRRIAELTAEGHRGAAVDVAPDSLGLVQFSSGATTDPKPVALSHRQLMAQLAAIRAVLPAERRDPQLGVSWLPLYHDMGLIGCLLLAVYYPGPLVLIPPENFLARPALWLRAISRHRATVSISPTFGYALAAKRVREAKLEGVDLSSWRFAGCGAEPISLRALEAFAARFGRLGLDPQALRPCYGLAEAALAVTFVAPDRPLKSIGVDPVRLATTGRVVGGKRTVVSVGTPVAGFEVEVRDGAGEPAPERRVGRVHAKGPSIMTGYFRQPEATTRAVSGGWLDTGDLGFIADGELYICGREKDVVIIRGSNHAPQEFEECADGLAGVRAGCVAALGFVPDGEDGEQLLVLAERAKDAAAGASDVEVADRIRRAVTEGTGVSPHTVRLLEPGTLPRTSSGKLRRGEALRRFLSGGLTPPRDVGPLGLSLEVGRSALALAKARLRRGR